MSNNLPAVTYEREVIPLVRLIELRNKGLRFDEIGAIVGCSAPNVQQRLKPYLPSVQHLPAIKEHRADLLTVMGHTILSSLSGEDIEKASAYQRVGMAGLLHNMERLERGQSTQNIATADYTQRLSQLDAEIARLQAEAGPISDDSEVLDV